MSKKEFPFSIKIKPDLAYRTTIATIQINGRTFRHKIHYFPKQKITPRARARKWAIENAKNNWCVGSKYIHFSNKTDAALFTIFWENEDER